jgi:hypothetical protein
MAARLRLGNAEQAHLCLQCHVRPGADPKATKEHHTYHDGVSCEACHGPAEKWIDKHQRWRRTEDQDGERQSTRMILTKKLRIRGQVCLDCHVGSKHAEVTHDLLAAGHPELRFELSAYHFALPKHWNETADKHGHAELGYRDKRPDLEARLWLIGQLLTAERSLELLSWKMPPSKSGEPARPWPEFAGYRCAACHQQLGKPSQQILAGPRLKGVPAWDSWYAEFFPQLQAEAWVKERGLVPKLTELSTKMSERWRPDLAPLMGQVRGSQTLLQETLEEAEHQAISVERVRLMLKRLSEPLPDSTTWQDVALRCVSLEALVRALGDLEPGYAPLSELRNSLCGVRCALDKWSEDGDQVAGARAVAGHLQTLRRGLER